MSTTASTTSHPLWILGISLGTVVVATALSSARVPFRDLPRSRLQPKSPAFSIWSLIFPLLFASAFVAGAKDQYPVSSVAFTMAALVSCIAWAGTLTFWPTRVTTAAVAIATACVCAWASLIALPWPYAFSLPHAANGLFAGWLSLASLLAWGMAGGPQDDVALAAASASVTIASAALATPVPPLAVLWGLAWVRYSDWALAAGAISLVGVIMGALVRSR